MTTRKVLDLLKTRNKELSSESYFGHVNPICDSSDSVYLKSITFSSVEDDKVALDNTKLPHIVKFPKPSHPIPSNGEDTRRAIQVSFTDEKKSEQNNNEYNVNELNVDNLEKIVKEKCMTYSTNFSDIHKNGNDEDSVDLEDKTLSTRCLHFWKKYVLVLASLILCGIGISCAGIILNHVQEWEVYVTYIELLTLIPPLLSLKGNTEMTLASRLSTQVNLGMVKGWRNKLYASFGNACLVTCQGVIVSTLASIVVCLIGTIRDHKGVEEWLLIIAACQATTVLSTATQTFFTVSVIFGCKKVNINPDDVATPIAASVGDCVTLTFLSYISLMIFQEQSQTKRMIICISIIVFVMLLLPVLLYMSFKNRYTNGAFRQGWVSIILSLIITGAGGQVLGHSITSFSYLALFQPFFNGYGGNVVSIISSRTSTYLNRSGVPGKFPEGTKTSICAAPWWVIFSNSMYGRTARRLLSMTLPGHLIFGFALHAVTGYKSPFANPLFLTVYLVSALIQICILLFIAYILIQFLWKKGLDPDNSAIPIMTAISDLMGTVMLAGVFWVYTTY